MPRVNTQVKSNRGKEIKCGRCQKVIEPGEKYHKWSFRYGGTRYACAEHPPKRSELTQSIAGDLFSAIEDAEVDIPKAESTEEVRELVTTVAEMADEVGQQYYDAAEPFGGGGDNGERYEICSDFASSLQSFYPDDDADLETVKEDALAAIGECEL